MTSFSSFPLQRCVLVAAALLCHGTTALSLLGRKSTANQVLAYLQQNDQLAPFVSQGGTAVITGGNSGIGAETVKALVASGMNVVVCARNIDSANQLKDELGTATKDRVEIEYLDLSSLASVQEAAASICSKHDGIDVLINNAGIMALPQRETTTDGIEKQFGTNHVGHHYLTRLLLPQMRNKGRVVNVASTAHNFGLSAGNEDWESKESYTPWGAYGTSKLSNILFTKQLKKELVSVNQGKMIDSVCLHPGVIASPLWKHSLPSFMQPLVGLIANKSVEQGAATSVYCALSRHVEDGAYYDDCSPVEPSQKAQSDQLQEALWMYTEQLLTEKGFELPSSSVVAENVAAVN
ncbi:Dehydrogenase/reductase SDR family member on chromosome X homolog [Seminavis robusta]|uniref:Dehydrogenase/reductase SDR family member on chromosome X homolog n=1 Tax=Seminavis robusta TaxID=568900 RepID=A0A9N8H736_9STRA|nr:Dehydrogenase/reductase SDR family member on chromosome X homolog [Seminavis robusta]|eukprot:Sro190_g081950.1 Dehydrogenase/reductase SDR family member on chromosome X homolog (351) ;mRNA; r:74055-75107